MAIAVPALPPSPSAPPREPELDRAVLARCRAGDARAFRVFVERYQRPVFACLSRIVGRGPQVEDLAQEVFVRAWRAMPGFDPDGPAKPSTWLLTIAARAALDARRRRVVPIRPLDDHAEQLPARGTPET